MKKRRLRLKMPITEARIAKATDLYIAFGSYSSKYSEEVRTLSSTNVVILH